WELRKRQEVPGHDPARYATERIAAPAADGTQVPVTIAYRAGARPGGTAPCLLYGYGAYESCDWPEVSVATPSLLDRGFVYAMAYVPGGWTAGGPASATRSPTSSPPPTCSPTGAGWRRTGSSRAGCPRAACSRARCSRWRRGGGARWWPRSRSWTA